MSKQKKGKGKRPKPTRHGKARGSGGPSKPSGGAKAPPPGLSRMAGGNGADETVEIRSKTDPSPSDSKPIASHPPPGAPAEGVQVVARGPSKFSLADLEALKAAIKIKGAGTTIEGINFDELKWDAEGLVPVISQDRRTGAVLMLSWTNRETLETTLKTKTMTYWDRNRNKVWTKSEDTGHAQRLVSLAVDCDKDSILATVEQDGPACHRDTGTCWTDGRAPPVATFVGELDRIIAGYAKQPKAGSRTSELLAEPISALKKLVEEANETVRVIQGKSNQHLDHKAADMVYHLLVACRTKGVGLEKIVNELYAQHLAMKVKKA